ncbi:MAG TPA: hypothetical protein VIU64_01940 [Polyangia bacterium]
MQRLADIPGPTTPDQAPTQVDAAHIVVVNPPVAGSVSEDVSGNIYIVGTAGRAAATPCSDACPPTIGEVLSLGPDLKQRWDKKFAAAQMVAAVRSNGEIYFGGNTTAALAGETQVGAEDATIGKLDPSGAIVWQHQWGATGGQATVRIGIQPDGSVLTVGRCSMQAPGNPPDNKGGPFAARFGADGVRTWLKQHPTSLAIIASTLTNAQTDAAGLMYLGTTNTSAVVTINPADGTAIQGPRYTSYGGGFGHATFAPDFKSFYAGDGKQLAQLNLDGSAIWYRQGATQTATIEPTEGVKWTGSFTTLDSAVAATADGIYISGVYANQYQNGSVARPTTRPISIALLDPSGQQIWFRELLLETTAGKFTSPSAMGFATHDPAVVVVFFQDSVGTYAVRLSKTDGAVL